jgi:hypothetical protein
MLDTDDCRDRGYLVVLDTRTGEIVWYLDVDAAASDIKGAARLSGWRYQPGLTSTSGRVLAIIAKERVAELGFDGLPKTVVDSLGCDGTGSGPCFHHDAWKSDVTGRIYVLSTTQNLDTNPADTAWDDADCTASYFNDDGFSALTGTEVTDVGYLMADFDYDPVMDGGPREGSNGCASSTWGANFPYGAIDWTHVNAISAESTLGGPNATSRSQGSDRAHQSDHRRSVRRLFRTPSTATWTSSWQPASRGVASFGDQHDVHPMATAC